MENFLNTVEIQNFKSIKQINLEPKRVNVFIGEPNVGKSNILEALSLLGANYSFNQEKFLSEFIRYEEVMNLFYDDDPSKNILINTDKIKAVLKYHLNNKNRAELIIGDNDFIEEILNGSKDGKVLSKSSEPNKFFPFFNNGKISELGNSEYQNPIKKYTYKEDLSITNKFPLYLLPPYGDNLFAIVIHNEELRKEVVSFFDHYDLNFVADKKNSKFEIQKNIDGFIYKYNYSSIADTFKRLVFYFAAIDSNKDSVLILEEPEVHSFPPYTKELSDRIIASEDNQFFITTHSPYLLQNMISNLDDSELNIYITYYEDYQTKVKLLSAEELRKVSDLNMDLFFNLDNFVK